MLGAADDRLDSQADAFHGADVDTGQPRGFPGFAGRGHAGAGAGPFDQEVGDKHRAQHPQHQGGNAKGLGAGQIREGGGPAANVGHAVGQHEGEAACQGGHA
ncbi:hypothetical protein G6F24_018419 [Rhizopus arrhizus]|nr:hypothetical protein G6F24_018419 [Rhizopus arrhizus]